MIEKQLKAEFQKDTIGVVEEIKAEKQFVHLGIGRRPFRNARLFEMDVTTFVVTEIQIESKKEVSLTEELKIKNAKFQCFINNSAAHLWAMNKENAHKKFMRGMNLIQKIKFETANR